jgi:hypothetical protein
MYAGFRRTRRKEPEEFSSLVNDAVDKHYDRDLGIGKKRPDTKKDRIGLKKSVKFSKKR